MSLTAWMQERFWAGFAIFVSRTGVQDKIDKLIADKLEVALEAEIAAMAAAEEPAP